MILNVAQYAISNSQKRKPSIPKKQYPYQGQMFNIVELSNITRILPATIKDRMYRQRMTMDQALELGVRGRGGRNG
jgi:hypothetical protein